VPVSGPPQRRHRILAGGRHWKQNRHGLVVCGEVKGAPHPAQLVEMLEPVGVKRLLSFLA
jgi:hypothetical protein